MTSIEEKPKIPRVVGPPAWGEPGHLRWRMHQAFAGGRPEDIALRKRLARATGKITLVSVLVAAITRLWLVVVEPILTEWPKQQASRDERLSLALERLAGSTEAMAEANKTVVSLALDRLGVAPAEPPPPQPAQFRRRR